MSDIGPPETKLIAENSLKSKDYDGIILVSSPDQEISTIILKETLSAALKYDPSLETEIAILPINLPAGRLIHSPTGPLDLDYDDVRSLKRSAAAGVKRALKAGVKRPLLVLENHPRFENGELVILLGVLSKLYVPIQVRESGRPKNKVEYLGVYSPNPDKTQKIVELAGTLEKGVRAACDIADADPERMSPPKVEEYVTNLFANTSIKVEIIKDIRQIAKEYPLFEPVNRAASGLERHQGRIIFLEYNPPESVKETLLFVGKGVTYDTGGADVKISGSMFGMSRDKCGAAAVAGFMHLVNLLQPKDIRVIAGLSIVRNSIGSNSYVADEIITARSGARVRIQNTDAEGRMVMADVLCKMKEIAVDAINPHLFTIATLTGHAALTVGEYTIAMDNGPARVVGSAQKLQAASEKIADPFEISTIRREDFSAHKGIAEGDDVIQSQCKPSTQATRGHQNPAAFLILASGLDKHGSGSAKPLKFTHLDIAGSAGSLPNPATAAPVLALAEAYLISKCLPCSTKR